MPTSTLSSKGQITLPKPIRQHLQIAEGDQIDFSIEANGSVVLHRLVGSVSELASIFYRPQRKKVSHQDMDNAIANAVTEKVGKR